MIAVPALPTFRDHLISVAALDLERLDPAWIGAARSTPNLAEFVHGALNLAASQNAAASLAAFPGVEPPPPMGDRTRFAPYRRLLTLVAELEMYLVRYEGIQRFASVPVDAAWLDTLGLTGLDWAWMLLNQVSLRRGSLTALSASPPCRLTC
jgi:hypothetical protein